MPDGFIPRHSGYKNLKSYQKSAIIYDATVYFCERFYRRDRRQTDQMEQAARSGKQNIAEGSMASATSKKTEIHLTNVARASLGELREDYEDFLRLRKLPTWDAGHTKAQEITELSRNSNEVYETYRDLIENESPEISANTIRHLIIQAMFMLNRQMERLERAFLEQGGMRERMTSARIAARQGCSTGCPPPSSLSSPSKPGTPSCPDCGSAMVRRTARQGARAGSDFWGCSDYPKCRGTRDI